MTTQNHTGESSFLLLGLSDDPQLQPMLCGIFLSMYLITVLGNLLIILAITSDPLFHTPMYFFLSNLSFVDVCFSTTTIPKMLVNIQTQRKDIFYPECLTQGYFFLVFAGMDNFLLTVMAYDHFVAICHPLNYPLSMNAHFSGLLVLVSWLIIFCISLIHVLLMKKLTFSPGTTIPHFFCELAQVLQVASSDTLINDISIYVATVLFCVFPALGIFFSYRQILSSLMKLSNMASKHKAFSTCGSHFCVVSLFYETGLGVYLSSAVSSSAHRSKMASVLYTVVTPMLNPFIYTLRNQDVMGALRKLPGRVVSCLDGL
ncbi:olfactory receptor 7D4-like [Thomomys bottae]